MKIVCYKRVSAKQASTDDFKMFRTLYYLVRRLAKFDVGNTVVELN